ncbi:CUB domain protein [Ancylostoma ceylanicum]|uniref:CUB domain protein n=1 Tax=Ancylostoma ceylanicum TaxID=53326 RepID=A0A0D6MB19_9BILA|nr:CUB domain protein [Ancylostoma ceylanicum]
MVMTGDVMETEFVTDRSISRHGYNMSVVSVQMPLECICPHKGMKVMTPEGSLQMDVPAHCTIVYYCNCNEGEAQVHEAVVNDWRELTSPAYPVPYCGDLECVYRIVAPTGHHVVLNITDFYTEPYNDVLALFDGVNTTGRHMDVFYGKKWFPYLIRSTNETMSLVFKTDHDVSYDGFRILFSAEPNDDYSAPLQAQSHTSTIIIFILSVMLVIAIAVAVYRSTHTDVFR